MAAAILCLLLQDAVGGGKSNNSMDSNELEKETTINLLRAQFFVG